MDTKTTVLLSLICLGVFPGAAVQAGTAMASPACETGSVASSTAAQWQKKRALYLHDLQISSFEQKKEPAGEQTGEPPPGNDFDIADDLIDANLYVSYAETDRLMLDNPVSARDDLKQALDKLNEAYALANGDEKPEIAAVKKDLVATRESINTCIGTDTGEARKTYQSLQNDIGRLVKTFS